jgi:predicted O-methyltransferase YrrM
LYLAAAVRDNGGGVVIGSEIVPAKSAAARRKPGRRRPGWAADLRVGDTLDTFAGLGGRVAFLLVDGLPTRRVPTLARSLIELVALQLRPGAVVVNDNAEPDFFVYVRDPAGGFVSTAVPLKGSTEISVKV